MQQKLYVIWICKKIDESQWLALLPLKPKQRTYILYKRHS